MQIAFNMTKHLFFSPKNCQNFLALLFTEILKIDRKTNHFVLLFWSPLRTAELKVKIDEYSRFAIQWLLERITSVILAFDAKSRNLWKLNWSMRCVNYLTVKSCRKFKNDTCLLFHKRLSAADCVTIISILIKINTIFCGSSILYYERIMKKKFQKNFFGIKRHWLEILVQELTFISSIERCSQTVVRVQSDFLTENSNQKTQQSFLTVASHVENLFFHRLKRK